MLFFNLKSFIRCLLAIEVTRLLRITCSACKKVIITGLSSQDSDLADLMQGPGSIFENWWPTR